MNSMFPPVNQLEIERAKFAYFGQSKANINTGAGLVVGAGRLAAVLPLAIGSGVSAGATLTSPALTMTAYYPMTSYTSGSTTYWPDNVRLYLDASAATTITVDTSPDGVYYYQTATWAPTASGSTYVDLGSVASVQVTSSAAVTLTAQVLVTNIPPVTPGPASP